MLFEIGQSLLPGVTQDEKLIHVVTRITRQRMEAEKEYKANELEISEKFLSKITLAPTTGPFAGFTRRVRSFLDNF